MKLTIILILLILETITSAAQKEYATLFLRNGCFVNFTNEEPESHCMTEKLAGTDLFALSDENGKLLAYGNGYDYYDSNNNLIFQTKSHNLQLNSGIMAVDPQNKHLVYYFYHSNTNYHDKGIRRNIDCILIDNSESINFEHKTIAENYTISNFLCVLLHADGKRLWLLSRGKDDNTIESFLIDRGKVTQKVVTNVEYDFIGGYQYSQILPNPEQNKLYCNYGKYIIFDFDNYTGKVLETKPLNYQQFSTFEFSPSGKYIYCTKDEDNAICIYRYATEEFENQDFRGEKICEFTYPDNGPDINITDMTLAYDGNIYFYLSSSKNSLFCIKNPDSEEPTPLGDAVNFDNNFDNFSFFPTHARFLPCFQIIESGCNTARFVYRGFPTQKVVWVFDDEVKAEGLEVEHHFTTSSPHTVKMVVDLGGEERAVSKVFTLDTAPKRPTIISE